MKKWEIELMNVMSKSGVDTMQKDVNNFINDLYKNIYLEVESGLLNPVPDETTEQQWYRMGKNRTLLDLSKKIKEKYIKD